MKLVSSSHVFSTTCIACCHILWHNLIFYKLNDFSVTWSQGINKDTVSLNLYYRSISISRPKSKSIYLSLYKNIHSYLYLLLTNDLFQENHQTARPLAWVDFGGISLFKGPLLTSCKPLISGTCPSGRMKQPYGFTPQQNPPESASWRTRHGSSPSVCWRVSKAWSCWPNDLFFFVHMLGCSRGFLLRLRYAFERCTCNSFGFFHSSFYVKNAMLFFVDNFWISWLQQRIQWKT